MKVIFFLLLSILIGTDLYSETATLHRKETLWKGEVTAVYKNKNRIRVTVYNLRNAETLHTKDKIKDFLGSATRFELKEKDTDRAVAQFVLKDMYLESLHAKGKKFEVDLILIGRFIAPDGLRYKKVSTNLYIEASNQFDNYIDASEFYHSDPSIPTTIIHSADNKEMVFVKGGFFLFGQGKDPYKDNYNPKFRDLNPDNMMDIPSFYIDKYEVTNAEYAKFLQESNHTPPAHWLKGSYPVGKEDHPVLYLTYREVELYANWSGKRIPTELEWEKAARGVGFELQLQRDESYKYFSNMQKYPFGNTYNKNFCNCAESGNKDTVSVYELAKEGASIYGAIGMCGNASEWTSSWYEPYPGQNLKNTYYGKIYKVIRGGSFIDSSKECRSDFRSYGGIPNLKEDRKAGFRLVADYKPK